MRKTKIFHDPRAFIVGPLRELHIMISDGAYFTRGRQSVTREKKFIIISDLKKGKLNACCEFMYAKKRRERKAI